MSAAADNTDKITNKHNTTEEDKVAAHDEEGDDESTTGEVFSVTEATHAHAVHGNESILTTNSVQEGNGDAAAATAATVSAIGPGGLPAHFLAQILNDDNSVDIESNNTLANQTKTRLPRQRKFYTTAFKDMALLFLQTNKEVCYSNVARKFGVSESSLRDWRRSWEKEGILVAGPMLPVAGPTLPVAGPTRPVDEAKHDEEETGKGKRRRYSAELKVEVLHFLKAHRACVNYEEVAKRFNVSIGALRDWRKREMEILMNIQEKRGSMKANPNYPLKKLSDAVVLYWEHNSKLPARKQALLSMYTVQEKALQIKQSFIDQQNREPFLDHAEFEAIKAFKVSTTWAARLVNRIKYPTKTLEHVDKVVAQYQPEHVYSVGKTLMFFKILPDKACANDDYNEFLPNTKHMRLKDRVTLYFCTNENGSKKVPPLVIAEVVHSLCHRWCSRKGSPFLMKNGDLSDDEALRKWWKNVFLPHIRRETSAPVLLITNLVTGSDLVDPKGQVRVEVLPKDQRTSHQPMEQGIIAAFKKNYRYQMLVEIFTNFYDRAARRKIARAADVPMWMRGVSDGSPPSLADAMRLVKSAWDNITSESIQYFWRKTKLRSDLSIDQDVDRKQKFPEALGKRTSSLLETFRSLIQEAQQSDEDSLCGEVLSDIEYEYDVIGALELSVTDEGQVREGCDLVDDIDAWCDVEERDAVKTYLAKNSRSSLNSVRGVEMDEESTSSVTTKALREVADEVKPDIEHCATNIMTIATQLSKASPEYHDIASELMKFPDKLLRRRKAIAQIRNTGAKRQK
ncbi:hypothetical protein ACA910_009143 [Epithemia clementina (nom. ined.)]